MYYKEKENFFLRQGQSSSYDGFLHNARTNNLIDTLRSSIKSKRVEVRLTSRQWQTAQILITNTRYYWNEFHGFKSVCWTLRMSLARHLMVKTDQPLRLQSHEEKETDLYMTSYQPFNVGKDEAYPSPLHLGKYFYLRSQCTEWRGTPYKLFKGRRRKSTSKPIAPWKIFPPVQYQIRTSKLWYLQLQIES